MTAVPLQEVLPDARRPTGDAGPALDRGGHRLPGPPRGRARPGGQHPRRVPAGPAAVRRAPGRAGVRGLGEVAEAHVAGFLAALREGDDDHPPLSASSAARAVVAVRGLHRFALRDGLVARRRRARGAAAGAAPPAAQGDLGRDVERLLEAAGGRGPRGLRDRALLEVLYGTGARISEAVGLDVDDARPRAAAVVLRGKGGKERVVPVGGYALRAVEDYLVRARPALAAGGAAARRRCSSTRAAAPLSRQSAWTILRSAAERAGLSGRGLAAHAAALVRHPPARRRRRRAGGPGAARPRVGDHHAGLHARHGRQAARGVRDRATLARADPPAGCRCAFSRRRFPRSPPVVKRRADLSPGVPLPRPDSPTVASLVPGGGTAERSGDGRTGTRWRNRPLATDERTRPGRRAPARRRPRDEGVASRPTRRRPGSGPSPSPSR